MFMLIEDCIAVRKNTFDWWLIRVKVVRTVVVRAGDHGAGAAAARFGCSVNLVVTTGIMMYVIREGPV